MILLLALLMASDAELPIEAAVKLREYRKLPAPISSAFIVSLIDEHGLGGNIAKDLAKEAYDTAMRVDRSIDLKTYPGIVDLGGAEVIAATAWHQYSKYRNRKVDPALPFPPRSKTKAARCDHSSVDTASPYLESALEAGEFEKATESLRSSKELAEAIIILVRVNDENKTSLGLALVKRLSLASDSRREFEETLKLDSLAATLKKFGQTLPERDRLEVEASYQRFIELNERNLPCKDLPKESEKFDSVRFRELKQKFMTTRWNDSSGYDLTEAFLKLYSMADPDPVLLDELEFSGDSVLAVLTRISRYAAR